MPSPSVPYPHLFPLLPHEQQYRPECAREYTLPYWCRLQLPHLIFHFPDERSEQIRPDPGYPRMRMQCISKWHLFHLHTPPGEYIETLRCDLAHTVSDHDRCTGMDTLY